MSARTGGGGGGGGGGGTLRVLLPVVAGALVLGALAALVLAVPGRREDPERPAARSLPTARAPEPVSSAPPAEVERVHDALHDIGRRCRAGSGDRPQPEIKRDVDVILDFAQRYPEGRFPIDDETAGVLSLLLGTREDLRTCAPAEAARVDRRLPPEFRDPTTGPS